MSARQDGTLVAGELRGFRQFFLVGSGLEPVVHRRGGPWSGGLERASCVHVPDHDAPVADCTCGLYAMYRPGSATVSLGAANAVVAARGRCILGDRGFRAASARVEAVALPALCRLTPRGAARARRGLAASYPGARVYGSTRHMLRDHPPPDVSGLGIVPPPDRSRELRLAALLVWAAFVLAGYSVLFLPQEAVSQIAATWWPALVLALLAWQAALVWLLCRLMALQMPDRHG